MGSRLWVAAIFSAWAVEARKDHYDLYYHFDEFPCVYDDECNDEAYSSLFIEDEFTCGKISLHFKAEDDLLEFNNCVPSLYCGI